MDAVESGDLFLVQKRRGYTKGELKIERSAMQDITKPVGLSPYPEVQEPGTMRLNDKSCSCCNRMEKFQVDGM